MHRATIVFLFGLLAGPLMPPAPEPQAPSSVDAEDGEPAPSSGDHGDAENAQRREKRTPPVYEETARHPAANAPQ